MSEQSQKIKKLSRISHNTQALEAAVLASIQASSLPSFQLIAQTRFDRAKALLIRVLAVIVSIIGCLIIIWMLLALVQKAYGGWPARVAKTIEAPSVGSGPLLEKITTEDEAQVRDRISKIIIADSNKVTKSIRSLKSDPNRSNEVFSSSARMGADLQPDSSKSNTVTIPPNEVKTTKNMVIGPEVQTLTVFNSQDVKLRSGKKATVVAGHIFENNRPTTAWKDGYCYVRFDKEVTITVQIASKESSTSTKISKKITKDEQLLLGGQLEVDRLLKVCPWLK